MDIPPDRLSAPPRTVSSPSAARQQTPARDEKLGERFAEQLAAKGQSLAEAEGSTGKNGALVHAVSGRLGQGHERFGQGRGGWNGDNNPDGSGGGAAVTGLEQRTSVAASAAPSSPAESGTTDMMIDRMAAAIAELRGNEASRSFRVDFPPGSAIAENALLTRDAQTGAISVRIMGLLPGIKERRRVEMEDDLRLGLQRRHITAQVEIDDAPVLKRVLDGDLAQVTG